MGKPEDDFILIAERVGPDWRGHFPAAEGCETIEADTPYVLRVRAQDALAAWLRGGGKRSAALEYDQFAVAESAVANGHEVWWIGV